jgi:hypothetical protein
MSEPYEVRLATDEGVERLNRVAGSDVTRGLLEVRIVPYGI